MGLDMYLNREIYIWDNDRKKIKIEGIKGIDVEKVNYIKEKRIYWRKANAIHAWFVKNVQKGKDDCKEYDVSKEDLKALLSIVDKVLKNRKLAPKLLPTQAGFFFGGTQYDEYYWQDLKATKKGLEEILSIENDVGDYTYRSSW